MKFKEEFYNIGTYMLVSQLHIAVQKGNVLDTMVLTSELVLRASSYTEEPLLELPISEYYRLVEHIVDEINTRISPFYKYMKDEDTDE